MIHRLARIHLTESRRKSVARMVSPDTRLLVSPCSKAASAATSKVHRLVSYPNSLGDRWSISLRASALSRSKAAWTRLRREDPAVRAFRPLSLKAPMAFLTVWEAHPRPRAILGGERPGELARSISSNGASRKRLWSAAPPRGSRARLRKANVQRLEVSCDPL